MWQKRLPLTKYLFLIHYHRFHYLNLKASLEITNFLESMETVNRMTFIVGQYFQKQITDTEIG